VEVTTEVVMRAAPRIFDWIGSVALVLALLLASPGVRVSRADPATPEAPADFSWDPALEPGASESALARSVKVSQPAGTCAAESAPVVMPTERALQGLRGMPLAIADGDEELNSLNARGYNIGKAEPSRELQALMAEIRRR